MKSETEQRKILEELALDPASGVSVKYFEYSDNEEYHVKDHTVKFVYLADSGQLVAMDDKPNGKAFFLTDLEILDYIEKMVNEADEARIYSAT